MCDPSCAAAHCSVRSPYPRRSLSLYRKPLSRGPVRRERWLRRCRRRPQQPIPCAADRIYCHILRCSVLLSGCYADGHRPIVMRIWSAMEWIRSTDLPCQSTGTKENGPLRVLPKTALNDFTFRLSGYQKTQFVITAHPAAISVAIIFTK